MTLFTAFQRSRAPIDDAVDGDRLHRPGVRLKLARRVYADSQGSIDIAPTDHGVIYVASATNGEMLGGATTAKLASSHGVGHTRWNRESGYMFVGVLAEGVQLAVIADDGAEIPAPVNTDDAYWFSVANAVAMLWTAADGTRERIELAEPRISGPRTG